MLLASFRCFWTSLCESLCTCLWYISTLLESQRFTQSSQGNMDKISKQLGYAKHTRLDVLTCTNNTWFCNRLLRQGIQTVVQVVAPGPWVRLGVHLASHTLNHPVTIILSHAPLPTRRIHLNGGTRSTCSKHGMLYSKPYMCGRGTSALC